MIGRLAGTLLACTPPQILIDVGGVGYDVEVPMSTLYHLPTVGEQVVLLTHLQVRDDAHLLYGFASAAERSLFRALLKVNGVGARVALAVLSGMDTVQFHHCIAEKDVAAMMRIPGIGKKTAERMILELPDRLQGGMPATIAGSGAAIAGKAAAVEAAALSSEDQAVAALAALEALGYKPAEAARLIKRADVDAAAPVQEWIRSALKLANTA